MRLIRSKECDVRARVRDLAARLSVRSGATSRAAAEHTIAVFGEPLSPAQVVERIIADVRACGDDAVIEYGEKLDGVRLRPETLWTPASAIEAAWTATAAPVRRAMERAAENIRAFQTHILQREHGVLERDGLRLRQRLTPMARVGVLVPAAAAPLPSSLLMCAIPAQVAGVPEIIVASAPGRDGEVRPEVLAAARVAGVSRVLRAGGAQAVAALALGTASVPRVDKVVGPGNLFVTLAKRALFGEVDIDLLAGPSEVLIIADATARPAAVAADLLAQAEHHPGAAVLVAIDERIASETLAEIDRQLPALARGAEAKDGLDRFGLAVVARDLDEAVTLANEMAPEHLELQVGDAEALLPRLTNAGAIFVGRSTPTALGDYLAGPSHVLPTGGTARFAGGLSANSFLKSSSVIEADATALARVADDVLALARCEGLDAHARSVEVRL
jgi:histidinol dehydrogenase